MKRCKHCKEAIQGDAEICKHCNRHQGKIWSLVNHISNTAGVVTILLFIVSLFQYYDSRQERIKAQEAMDTATKLYNRVDSLNRKLNSTIQFVNKTTLLAIQNSLIQANNPLLAMTPRTRLSLIRYETNVNGLVELLIPDSVARRRWSIEIDSIIHH